MDSTDICSPRDQVTKTLEIRQANTQFEIDQLRGALNTGHYLKGGDPLETPPDKGFTRPMSMKTTPCCASSAGQDRHSGSRTAMIGSTGILSPEEIPCSQSSLLKSSTPSMTPSITTGITGENR